MLVEFFLAKKYLKPKRGAVSLITVISILGVALGVAALLVVLAVMTGFTDLMKAKLIETQAHFQIRKTHYSMRSTIDVERAVKSAGGECTPVIQGMVLTQYGPRQLDMKTVVFATREKVLNKRLNLSRCLKSGKLDLNERHIVIGAPMAARWGVNVGDKVLLHSARRLADMVKVNSKGGIELNSGASAYLPTEFTVSGIYSIGKYDFDNAVMFIALDDAAELFDLPWGAATVVFGWGADPFHQEELIEKIRAQLPPGYEISTWEQINGALLGVLAVEKRMMFFLLIFIVLVAAFSIASTLITSVYQKTREIGVLKAIGASDGVTMSVFVLQGFMIGVIGSVCGTLLGMLVIAGRNKILAFASDVLNTPLFPPEFYYFNELPAHLLVSDVLVVTLSSVLLCTAGAFFPALRAAKLEPAKALRYE